jgi:hypothetical protein
MKERDIERALIKRVKEVGGEVRKVVWQGRRGAPDRLVLLPKNRRKARPLIFVELKAPKGKVSRLQALEHEILARYGVRVVVVNSIEQIEEVIA